MLNKVGDYIEKIIEDVDQIAIESKEMYGDSKLEYALSTDNYMASISILSDYTYDFFAIEITSENTMMVKTKQLSHIKELYLELDQDIQSFSKLENA